MFSFSFYKGTPLFKTLGFKISSPEPDEYEKAIEKTLAKNNLPISTIKDKIILILFLGEGQSSADVDFVMAGFLKFTSLENLRVVFGYNTDVSILPYRAKIHQTHLIDICLINYIEPIDYKITHKFICLARRTDGFRAMILGNLIKHIESLQCSFGAHTSRDDYATWFAHHFPKGTKLPIELEDEPTHTSYVHAHKSLFNVILETSSQHNSIWSTNIITEKTFKYIIDFQIPIWAAVPGFVSNFRELGFDMFDDIVDHNYDNILDENARVKAIINQCADLNKKYSLSDCQDLRYNLMPRFKQNLKLFEHYTKEKQNMLNDCLDSLLE